MPDGGTAPDLIYRHAVRGRFAPLIMISGPSGVGKTYSALRLARGMVGPDGRIFVADTDNGRAKLYADEFGFEHLDLREPFRPKLFEDAAIAAQRQGADVLIVDNFSHEWSGPGGVLEWHEEELDKLSQGNPNRRDAMKMVGWARVKPSHKHLFQRIYRMNVPVVLCCAAERKVALVEQVENGRKKTVPIDLGLQPIGDKDAAFAMTASLMLEDVAHPGVPRPIKALLPALKPIIQLDRPLDEATGARIAAWAKGEPASVAGDGQPKAGSREETAEPPPSQPPPESEKPGEDQPPSPPRGRRHVDEASIETGAKDIGAKFLGAVDRAAYLALVDNADLRKQMEWLKRNRRELYDREVESVRKASWQRTDPKNPAAKQGNLMDDQADRPAGDDGRG